jgi:zinc and cadmium transporter
LFLNLEVKELTTYLLPFTAGGFIYIAGSDLIPEIQKEVALRRSLIQLVALLLGIALMLVLLLMG